MRTSSAKAKGRRLQQWVAGQIIGAFGGAITQADVRSTSSGVTGCDVTLSEVAFRHFPYSVECKNREALKGVYDMYDQAESHGRGTPVVFMKSNNREPLALISAEHFFQLIGGRNVTG